MYSQQSEMKEKFGNLSNTVEWISVVFTIISLKLKGKFFRSKSISKKKLDNCYKKKVYTAFFIYKTEIFVNLLTFFSFFVLPE